MSTIFERQGTTIQTDRHAEVFQKLNLRLPVIDRKTTRFFRRPASAGLKPLLKAADVRFTNSELGPLLLFKRSTGEYERETEIGKKVGQLVHAPVAHLTFANGEQRAAYSLLRNYISMNDYIKNVADRKQRIELAAQLGGALKQLHDNFITHGDLHPENVMLEINDDGRVTDLKFIDLPQARILTPKEFRKTRKVDFKVLLNKLKFLNIKLSKSEIRSFAEAYAPQAKERKI